MSAQIDVGTIVEKYAAGEHEMAGDIRRGVVSVPFVNRETGEIVEECTPEQARELTNRIRQHGEIMWTLVKRAYRSRVWAALGYGSWDEYCAEEFGKSRMKLPREERQEVVASLRESGLSTRAIAAATGVARNTIKKDLHQVDQSDPPEPEDATQKGGGNDGAASGGDAGSDSEPTPVTGPLDAASSDGPHGHDVGRIPTASPDPEPEPQPARVTGIDGKSYAAKRDREVKDQAAKELGQEGDVKAERLRVNFARLHAQFHKGLLALSPEHVAAAIDGDEVQWRLIEETRREAIEWYDRVLAARPKPFTVIKGGRD